MSVCGALWFAVHDHLLLSSSTETPEVHNNNNNSTRRERHPISTRQSDAQTLLDRFHDSFLSRHFHLNRQCLRFIMDYIHFRLQREALPVSDSLMSTDSRCLAALCFYARGRVPDGIPGVPGVQEAAAVETLTRVLSDVSSEFISFPGSYNDRMAAAQGFRNISGIPHVVGMLAYLHVKVSPPAGQGRAYENTLGYPSAAMQVVFDADGNILSLEQCWPGGTPEHKVWASSLIGKQFTTFQHGHSWVLGGRGLFGGGHVLSPILESDMTTLASKRFNRAHARVYGRVQEFLGALKSRFRCLRDIGSFSTLKSVACTIKACCVLHNISKKFSVPLPGNCILEPLHPPSSEVTGAAELPYDYMEDTKKEMIETFFGHAAGDED